MLDALQGILHSLKTRRTVNGITIEEVSEADDPTGLPVSQDVAGSPANHSA